MKNETHAYLLAISLKLYLNNDNINKNINAQSALSQAVRSKTLTVSLSADDLFTLRNIIYSTVSSISIK